jgi:hypothetical protein
VFSARSTTNGYTNNINTAGIQSAAFCRHFFYL